MVGLTFPVAPDRKSSDSNQQPNILDPQEKADRPELRGGKATVYAA